MGHVDGNTISDVPVFGISTLFLCVLLQLSFSFSMCFLEWVVGVQNWVTAVKL